MKLSVARTLVLFAAGMAAVYCAAQNRASNPSAAQSAQPGGKVILSRSIDENGITHDGQTGAAAAATGAQMAATPSVEDADREAVVFTDFDMDVRLRLTAQQIAVRALVAVRNNGKTPLARIPLQISSSLNWERIRVNGRDVGFPVATLNSDADHTGQLHEAAVPLATPLLPGQSIQLDVSYGGAIAPSAQRLLAIGTPEGAAALAWPSRACAGLGM